MADLVVTLITYRESEKTVKDLWESIKAAKSALEAAKKRQFEWNIQEAECAARSRKQVEKLQAKFDEIATEFTNYKDVIDKKQQYLLKKIKPHTSKKKKSKAED